MKRPALEIRPDGRARRGLHALGFSILVVVLSTIVGMGVMWRAPGLDLYSRDWLMRWRGRVPPPEEIVLLAIDEASIARLGRFPWSRKLMAQTLDSISAARPRAIALDVLYTDPADRCPGHCRCRTCIAIPLVRQRSNGGFHTTIPISSSSDWGEQ